MDKVEEVMSFFSNPFSTPVGHKIEQATDPNLASENWGLNLEICDMINSSEEIGKDAIRAIKKRLTQTKNYTVIMYTLTVLETCVKNSNHHFHTLVCSKEFINELLKVIGSKNDPPQVITEKTLSLIQFWADSFKSDENLQGVVTVYEELKAKGIEFPMTDLDSMAPIVLSNNHRKSNDSEPILHPVVLGAIKPTGSDLAKLRNELGVVEGNMNVFAEMLTEFKPGENQHPDDILFLKELYLSCQEMQRRIGNLLCYSISDDELVSFMLHLNDELNNLFLRYGRCCKNIEKQNDSAPSLIDLNVSNSQKIDVSGGAIPKTNQKQKIHDEFDMFAQSRNKPSGSTYLDNATKLPETTLREAIIPSPQHKVQQPSQESTLSSSEFDKFLAERAAAPKPK